MKVFVDQLKRLADVPICNCTKPPTFVGTKRFNPTAQHLDKEHLGHPREHSELAGTLDRCLGHHPLQDRLEPASIRRGLQVQERW
jgi:hypothetical protein